AAINSCPKAEDVSSVASTVRTRQRVTHLHMTPTSNPEMTVRKLTIGRLETPIHLVSCEFILTRVTSSNTATALGIDDVRAAAARIAAHIHRTPLLPSRSLSEKIGAEVRLKCENLQRAGSFKIRGAMNALLQLSDDERRRGVVAFSSGNHAQGDAIVVPLGGGGLLSGTALAATSLKNVDVYGVEPRAGNDGEQSFRSGRIVTIEPPKTIADGARTLAIGERNFAIIHERVRDVVS